MEKILEETMKVLSTANGKNAGGNSTESGLSLESSKGEAQFLGTIQNEESDISDEKLLMNGNDLPLSEETSYTTDHNSTKLSEDNSSSKNLATLTRTLPPPLSLPQI